MEREKGEQVGWEGDGEKKVDKGLKVAYVLDVGCSVERIAQRISMLSV